MTHPALGRESVLHVLAQAAPGVAAAGDYLPTHYYHPFDTGYGKPFQADDRTGPGLNNALDPLAPAPGLVSVQPRIIVPLCVNNLGLWLPHLFGAAAPSGTAPDFTHVFTSGVKEHDGLSLAWQDNGVWQLMNTLTLSSMSIPMGQEQGFRAVEFSGMASDVATPGSSPVGTPVSPLAYAPVSAQVCGIRKGGVAVGTVQTGSFRYNRTLVEDRPARVASVVAERFIPDANPEITVEMTARVTNQAFYDDAESGAPAAWEFEWRISETRSLVIACPALRVQPYKRSIEGVGTRTETITLRGEQTAGAPAVTVTLKNAVASYPAEAA